MSQFIFGCWIGFLAFLGLFITLTNLFIWAFRTGCPPEWVHDTEYVPVKHVYCPLCGRATPIKRVLHSLEFYECRFGHKFALERPSNKLYSADPV